MRLRKMWGNSVNQLTKPALTMSSLAISELVESRHDKVKQSIERLATRGTIQLPPLGEVKNQQNQTVSVYHLNKRDSYVVVAQLSPEFTAVLVDRWQELEERNSVPQSLPEALRLAADLAEQKQLIEQKLAIAAPKADFVDQYVQANGSMTFRAVCKMLKVKEPDFKLFLLNEDIMYLLSGGLMPLQRHINAKRFEVKTGTNQINNHAFMQSRFTAKGVNWVSDLWRKYQAERTA